MKQKLYLFQKNPTKQTKPNKQTNKTNQNPNNNNNQNKKLWKKPSSMQLPEVIDMLIQTIEDYKSKQLFNLLKFSLGFMFKADTGSQDFQVKYLLGVKLKRTISLCQLCC